MRRRGLLTLSTLAVLFFTHPVAFAQMADRVYRVGVLAPGGLRPIESFRERLRQLGWIEGRNIRFDYRSAEGDDNRQPALAAELVALPVDLILTWGTPAALAAKQATAAIPIVMGAIGDPVAQGVVPNLAHPSGNVTGFASQNLQLEEKRFEMLRELVPGMARIVMLGNTGNAYVDLAMKHIGSLAASAGLKFDGVKIEPVDGLESGLDAVRRAHPDGVLVEAGGLIAYSTNLDDLFRQAADYADKILKGASPGELPVQQAATFELVVNLGAAKALGLAIPPMIAARADEDID